MLLINSTSFGSYYYSYAISHFVSIKTYVIYMKENSENKGGIEEKGKNITCSYSKRTALFYAQ